MSLTHNVSVAADTIGGYGGTAMCSIYCWQCKDTGFVYTSGGEIRCKCVEECVKCHEESTKRHRDVCALDRFIDYFDLTD